MCPEGPGPELQPTAMLKSTPEDRKQVREWRKAARLLQHPLPVRPGGGSLGRRGSAGQRGPGGLPLSCPTRITLPPPCRSFTPCNCHCEPWKMGLGPGRRLAATGWPSVIKGEAGTSVCSFCGRHCPPGGCPSFMDRPLPGVLSGRAFCPKLPESFSLSTKGVPRGQGAQGCWWY